MKKGFGVATMLSAAMLHRLPPPQHQQGLHRSAEGLPISHAISCEPCIAERMLKPHHWTD